MFKYRFAQENAGASSFRDAVVEIGYLQGQLFELNRRFTEQMQQCQSRSEATESRLCESSILIADLQSRLSAASEQLTNIGNEFHYQRERAELAESRLHEAEFTTAELQSRLNTCFEQLTNIGNEFHAQRDRANALQMHLQSIFESRSWRLTKPIRVIFSRFRRRLNV